MPISLDDIAEPISDLDFSGEDIARLNPTPENREWFQAYADLRDLSRRPGSTDPVTGIINYERIVEISRSILVEKSKDLRTAAQLCRGLFYQNGFAGLAEGLKVCHVLLEKFWDRGLYPLGEPVRIKSLDLMQRNLDSDIQVRNKDLIPGSEGGDAAKTRLTTADVNVLKKVAADLEDIKETIEKINAVLKEKMPDGKASLTTLSSTLNTLNGTVTSQLQRAGVSLKPEEEKTGKRENEKTRRGEDGKARERGSEGARVESQIPEVTSGYGLTFSSDIEAIRAVIQVARFFLEKNRKNVVPYRLVRSTLWYSLPLLNPEPDKRDGKKVMPIPAPTVRARLADLLRDEDWESLSIECENVFAEGFESGGGNCFCLDIQRFLCTAIRELARKSSEQGDTRGKEQYDVLYKAILQETAMFVENFPYVTELLYLDRTTQLADDQTKSWIEKSVKPVFGASSGTQQGAAAGPAPSEESTKIAEDFEKASDLLARQKMEDAITLLQTGINTETTSKGRFQRRLNLANLCLDAGQAAMARPLLEQLDEEIQRFSLDQWEPGLCVQVWARMRRCYQLLLQEQGQQESNGFYKERADRIFEKLCRLDIRAAMI